MDDRLEAWLRTAGLQERIPAFRAQAIALDQLPDLSDKKLSELGLTVTERMRFQRALQGTWPPEEAGKRTMPEHRPLTMMFVDLVGSSELAERLEPEDLLRVLEAYREFCGEAIGRFGGAIARTVGDGILAYFSYPVAHEDDPERAVRAALAIVRDAQKLDTAFHEPLQVRIGIATGRVLIADIFAGGQADKRSIVGSAPNLAARLQTLAEADQVVIADETYDRVRHLFTCESMGELAIRGLTGTRKVWRVLGEASHYGYRPGSRPRRYTTFCNRKDDLALLMERWAAARQDGGNAVLLLGEAGIGKSRLVETFLAKAVERASTVAQLAASPFDSDSALFPFRLWLRAAAGIGPDVAPAEHRRRLAAMLPPSLAQATESVTALAVALGIESGVDPEAAPFMTAARLREQILAATSELILAQAAERALCLGVEDVHWLDPTSLELLERLARNVAGRKMLILLTAREDFAHPALAESGVTVHRVRRLDSSNTAEMVQSALAEHTPSAALLEQIARKCDGVPLFVEEVARSLLQRRERLGSTGSADELDAAVPASIHELLTARLDRSGIDKELAQAAAVIGPSVRLDVLARVADLSPQTIETRLRRLTEAGILTSGLAADQTIYSFTHALLRDAAYESIPRDRRRSLHLRVADALQMLDPGGIEQQPELLALHLTEGGEAQAAAPHWIKAARNNLARWALTEAMRLLRRGLNALDALPPTEENIGLRLEFAALLGPALISLHGAGSREAQALYNNAYALCEAAPERRFSFPIYWGWWRISRDFNDSFARARMLMVRASEQGDAEVQLQAHHCNWAAAYFVGDLGGSRAHAESGLRIYAEHDFTDHASLYGNHDPKVCAHGELAQVLWMQGQTRAALEQERSATEWAGKLAHLGSLVHARDMRLLHRIYRREFAVVLQEAMELIQFTTEHGLADHRAKGLVFRGWAMAMLGEAEAGLSMLEEGLEEEREIAGLEDFPVYTALWAEVLMKARHFDRAIVELGRAREEFERIGLGFWKPELIRLEGEARLAGGSDVAASLALFENAMEVARMQGAWMLHLRAAVSAAGAQKMRGFGEAGALLVRNALAIVTLEDDDQDLADARTALSQLA